jgi:hypothetical protein
MGDASRDTLRGLLIEDVRLRGEDAIWTAGSTGLTQAGRALGRPTTSSTTAWRIEARGDAEQALDVQCIRGGIPGSGLGVAWKQSTESATSYRGQDAPVAIRGSQTLDLGTASSQRFEYPDALTLQDGTVVIVSVLDGSILTLATQRRIRCRTIDSGSGTVSSAATVATLDYPNEGPHPFLVSVPREDGSERVLCGVWVEDSATGSPDAANIDLYFSDDKGATWAIYARSVLQGTTTIDGLTSQRDGINIAGTAGSGSTGFDLRRCRAAYANGQILLMMHLVHHDTNVRRVGDFLFQWQSSDLGSTFQIVDEATSKVATDDGAYRGGAPVVRSRDGLFHVAYLKVADLAYAAGGSAGTITVGVQIDRLGGAAQRFSDVAAGDSANPTLSDGGEVAQFGSALLYGLSEPECALALLPAGTLAVYWMRPVSSPSGHEIRCAQSDDGVSFVAWGSSMFSANFGTVWDVDSGDPNPLDGGGASNNTTNHPRQFATTGQGGRVAFVSRWVLDGTAADRSLTVLMLGGYHSQTLGSSTRSSSTRPDAAVGWEHCWYGLHQPDNVRWTENKTNSPTITFPADGMRIVSGATDAEYWSLSPSGSGVEGVRLRWVLSCATGNTAGDFVAVRLKVRDGSHQLDVSIRYSSSQVVVRDNHAGSTLVTAAVDMTSLQEFEIAAKVPSGSGGDLVLYQRPASLKADSLWTQIADVAPSVASSAAALHEVQFGTIAQGITDATWHSFYLVTNNHTGLRDLVDVKISNPGELQPVRLSGRYAELNPGAFVRAVDGPGVPAESYAIPLAFEYAAARALPAVLASPSQGWRSTDETAQSIAFAFNPSKLATEESGPIGDTWGVHLAGINWNSGTLQGYDTSSSSWVSITALDFETQVSYTRTGNVVELSSSSITENIREGEFDGAYIDLGSSKRRRIAATRGGLLTSSGGTVRRPRLVLEDVDATEPASGTGNIKPRQATVIVRNATTFAGIRISIDAQSTVDGFFTLGAIVAGPFVVFGTDYSFGRVIAQEFNVELNEARGGQRMPYKAGPNRRTVEVAWTDGIDVSQVDTSQATADYMLSTSSAGIEPVAYNRAVVYTVDGVASMLDGPLRPVVYVPVVPKGAGGSDSLTLTRRADAVYGRITSPVRLENILGDENKDEVWRVARLTIQEEV